MGLVLNDLPVIPSKNVYLLLKSVDQELVYGVFGFSFLSRMNSVKFREEVTEAFLYGIAVLRVFYVIQVLDRREVVLINNLFLFRPHGVDLLSVEPDESLEVGEGEVFRLSPGGFLPGRFFELFFVEDIIIVRFCLDETEDVL